MNKPIKIALISAAAIVAVSGGYFGARALIRTPETDSANTKTNPTSKTTDKPVENPVENNKPTSNNSESGNKTPAQYEGEDPNTFADLTGDFSVKRLENDKLTLRVNIDQYLGSGTCTLSVTDSTGALLVENSVEIVPEASTSTCTGFDLSDPALASASRPLNLSLILTSGDKQGKIEETLE